MALVAVISTHLLWQQFVNDFKPLQSWELIEAEVRNPISQR